MKKTVLTFGLISGAITGGMMLLGLPLADSPNFKQAEIIGYTTIVLSSLIVFFGVRSYRDNVASGRLSFGRGLAVGILITLISSAIYVGTWELIYYKLRPDFGEKFAAHMVEQAKASGASPQKIEERVRQAQQFKQMYDKPAVNVAYTFIEVFPFGLVVTLISAAVLRNKDASAATLAANG
jgi:hypothetical protein